MGSFLKAVRSDVTVVEKNSAFAAVEAATLTVSDDIILRAGGKQVSEGVRVREKLTLTQ